MCMQNQLVESKKLAIQVFVTMQDLWEFLSMCVAIRHTNDVAPQVQLPDSVLSLAKGLDPFFCMDQVACTGTETRLVDCPSNPLGDHDCSHYEGTGVTCRQI